MNLKYYEKLIISLVVFVTVTIGTGAIIGIYVKTASNTKNSDPNRIVLDNINIISEL